MTTTPRQPALCLIILLLLSVLLFSCGGGNPAQEGNGAGIAFRLKWPVAKSVGVATADIPPEVVTVRMSVSALDMTTISKDFAASARTGSIDNVPVGSGRTITFQGLDSSVQPIIIYQAVVPGVNLEPGTNTLDPVTMDKVLPPAPPSGLTPGSVSYNQVKLVWVDNAKYETGYSIERKSGAAGTYATIGKVAGDVITYTDLTVLPLTEYYYRVKATTTGIGESGYSNEANVTTPEQTYGISGTITSGGSALAGVTITQAGSGSTATTTNSAGNYSFSGAQNGDYTLTPSKTDYTFSPTTLAVTVSGANQSAMNFVATPVPIIPAAPSSLVATAVSSNLINLAWTDNAGNETGYKIERAESGGTFTQIDTVAANVTTYKDIVPAASTAYSYRVQATSGAGDSGFSIKANATTPVAGTPITPDLVTVTGTLNFSIGRFEVTQREWLAVMGNNPSLNPACGLDCPVENVSWLDIQDFIATLNIQSGSGSSYRLPTEAEWQYAAQSGGQNQLYSGGSDVNLVAWYIDNSRSTILPVGKKGANGLEIYDMSGNASEWVNDRFGSTGNNKVIRGGSWRSPVSAVTTTFRSGADWAAKGNNIGFRLARNPTVN